MEYHQTFLEYQDSKSLINLNIAHGTFQYTTCVIPCPSGLIGSHRSSHTCLFLLHSSATRAFARRLSWAQAATPSIINHQFLVDTVRLTTTSGMEDPRSPLRSNNKFRSQFSLYPRTQIQPVPATALINAVAPACNRRRQQRAE